MLELVPGVVALVEEDSTIRWISASVREVAGYTPEELVGTNIFDHLDVTWNPRTVASISYALENPGRRLPTLLRFRTKDGGHLVMEVMANNQFDTAGVRALTVHLRDVTEQQLMEEVLDAVAAGAPLDVVHGLLASVARSVTLQADLALVSFGLADGPAQVLATSADVRDLTTTADPDSPWDQAVVSAGPVLVASLDELPPNLRRAAEHVGYRSCWAYPVPRLDAPSAAAVLVFWRAHHDVGPEPNAEILAERMVRLAAVTIDRVEHLDQLHHAASHDDLTGLANRDRFFVEIDRHLADDDPVGVIYLDLDRFKQVNDVHGHSSGDTVLRAVADRLRACVRTGDLVARLGGDEFAICCPGAVLADLVPLAERLLVAVPAPIEIDPSGRAEPSTTGGERHRPGVQLTVGASIGVATAPGGTCSADVLVDAADTALLSAKATAKGSWQAAQLPQVR